MITKTSKLAISIAFILNSTVASALPFIDSDKDGIEDFTDNCPITANQKQFDKDKDGIGNACDDDIDGDGFSNLEEKANNSNPRDPQSIPGTTNLDSDNDSIIDSLDNCPINPNKGQWDKDKDGIGNKCDDDIDGDGYSNKFEKANNSDPYDKDSIPNTNIVDKDGDTVADINDNCPNTPNKNQFDKDKDGIGNPCDPDMDGDTYSNDIEIASGTNPRDPKSFPQMINDKDGDTVADEIDNCPTFANANQNDLDQDNIGDLCDNDIDGDGFSNVDEIEAGTNQFDATDFPEENIEYKDAMSTHFLELGQPYGGCGVPQDLLETQSFVALNVYDTPGDYTTFWTRPLAGEDLAVMGEFANGKNCGRWVEVYYDDDCTGTNDGAQNKPFCHVGEWVEDQYSGAKLTMIVADSCGDGNSWCRDDRNHLDLSTSSLNKFEKDGSTVDIFPHDWRNRKLKWRYIKAPDYQGDINIYFMQDAQVYWPAIMINNLENGIHGVEQWDGTKWLSAKMNSDLGQSYILPEPNALPFKIRVLDINDQYINNGRTYTFDISDVCDGICSKPATLAEYITEDPEL